MMKEMKVRLMDRERLNNSIYGNPRYSLRLRNLETLSVFLAKTTSDSSCVYAVSNYELGSVVEVTYHVTRSGNILIDSIRAER